jgi:hypothetical protein
MSFQHALQLPGFNGSFDCRAELAFAPGRVARLVARLRSGALDQELIAGVDPASCRRLAARAAQLTAPAARSELAADLERLAAASGAGRRWAVLPHRRAIAANAAEIGELAELLRASVPLYARGLAMLRALLADGAGPVYNDRTGRVLSLALSDAHAAARSGGPVAPVSLR